MADDRFQIGGETLLGPVGDDAQRASLRTPGVSITDTDRSENLKEVRVRVGTLLKTETVSLLLGAGASVDCGGQLIGSVPLSVEQELINDGIVGTQQPRIRRWIRVFYEAVRHTGDGRTPTTRQDILARRSELQGSSSTPLPVNFEHVLATLQRWRAALPETGGRLRLDGPLQLSATGQEFDDCLNRATRALARACDLPTIEQASGLTTFNTLVRKLLTRPLNLKRANIFTLNYDTLVEQAADAMGTVLLDGFVGTQRRVFRPESYEQDLYFPAETTEGRVHRFDRVLHLYKLHGSITWTAEKPELENPYGVESSPFGKERIRPLLIYPTPAKYNETLGLPYSELFRRFATTLVRPQSVLFVIGYGFGDEHVNAIIRQGLGVPSFTLVIVDPSPRSTFVKTLRTQRDSRIWISEGSTLGTMSGFVDEILPDLHDEEILRKVFATHNALANDRGPRSGSSRGA